MNRWKNFKAGLIKDNPVFSLYLGICSTLAITTTVNNAIGMGAAVIMVLILSNVIISCIRKITPDEIRIPVYIVIIASLVTIIQMLIQAFAPSLNDSLGVFIPLIVVNCIILGRAESFASKNKIGDSIIDALGYSAGFAGAIIIVAFFRELLGTGCLSWGSSSVDLFSDYKISLFASNAGAFIALGIVVGIYSAIMSAIKNHKAKKAALAKEADVAATK